MNGEISSFHLCRWQAHQSGIYKKSCIICGKGFEEVSNRMMLDELVLVIDLEGCCEIKKQAKEVVR